MIIVFLSYWLTFEHFVWQINYFLILMHINILRKTYLPSKYIFLSCGDTGTTENPEGCSCTGSTRPEGRHSSSPRTGRTVCRRIRACTRTVRCTRYRSRRWNPRGRSHRPRNLRRWQFSSGFRYIWTREEGCDWLDWISFRCQFHQRFYVRFFRTNIISAAFSSYVLALAKNLYKKRARLTLMKLTAEGR